MEKDFDTQLTGFVAGAQGIVDEYMKRNGFSGNPKLIIKRGTRYVRIFKGGSVYCFVDTTNGNVLKTSSYKAPETKNPRSNIFADDFGVSGVTEHGAKYIRP